MIVLSWVWLAPVRRVQTGTAGVSIGLEELALGACMAVAPRFLHTPRGSVTGDDNPQTCELIVTDMATSRGTAFP